MAEQPEARLQKKMVKRINGLPCPSRARKMHGGPHMRAGEPDIDAVICGVPCKIEVKTPGNKPTPLQAKRLDEWCEAGAVSGWVTSIDELDVLIRDVLGQATFGKQEAVDMLNGDIDW